MLLKVMAKGYMSRDLDMVSALASDRDQAHLQAHTDNSNDNWAPRKQQTTSMPWYYDWSSLAFPQSLQKRLFAFLLQKGIGQFLENDLDIDRLNLQLGNGVAEIHNVAIKVEVYYFMTRVWHDWHIRPWIMPSQGYPFLY